MPAPARARAWLLAAFCLMPVLATAAGTPTPPRDPPPAKAEPVPEQPPDSAAIREQAALARSQTSKEYDKGYAEVEEAKGLLKENKQKEAKKKFERALKRFERVVEQDPAFYEAWNMLGYCARNTGDLKRAFDAYQKCLAINPEYDEAHEYLGEAYLMQGNVAKAKEQLAWLKSRSSDEAAELEEKIAKAEAETRAE